MPTDKLEEGWRGLGEEVFKEMADWRRSHPRATLKEIEAALDERLDRLRAHMLEEVALAQVNDVAEATKCPECGQLMEKAGSHMRQLQTQGKQTLKLEREYQRCPKCGHSFFPPG